MAMARLGDADIYYEVRGSFYPLPMLFAPGGITVDAIVRRRTAW
jgi:hypothetical protein